MRALRTLLFAAAAMAAVTACVAATRSTPVQIISVPTVKFDPSGNTVKIDPAANTVKSEQSGAWVVRVDPLQNTVNALAAQNGAWTVGISDTANTVKTEPAYRKVTLFPGYNAVIAVGERHDTSAIDCRGFKEIRILINYNSTGGSPRVGLSAKGPVSDSYYDVGYFSGTSGIPDFTYGEWVGQGSQIWFSAPVVSDYMKVWIRNTGGFTLTCWGGYSYAYLVD